MDDIDLKDVPKLMAISGPCRKALYIQGISYYVLTKYIVTQSRCLQNYFCRCPVENHCPGNRDTADIMTYFTPFPQDFQGRYLSKDALYYASYKSYSQTKNM